MDFLGGAVPPAVAARLAAAHNPASLQAEVIAVDGGMDRGTTDSDDGKKEKASASFTVKVSTTHDGYNSYTVKRRYRQFDALQTQLKAQFKGVPELPAKDSFARKDGAYLEKRRSGLDVYLRALVADPVLAACEDTRQFLELASARARGSGCGRRRARGGGSARRPRDHPASRRRRPRALGRARRGRCGGGHFVSALASIVRLGDQVLVAVKCEPIE